MSNRFISKIKEFVTNNATLMLNHRYVPLDELYRGKVVLITGDSGDIGLITGNRFLQQGAKVILARKCIEEIEYHQNSDCHLIQWDIANSTERSKKFASCLNVFGEINIWVNCVQYINAINSESDYFNTSEQEWNRQICMNCKELYFMTQLIGRYFRENKIAGHIVQILNEGLMNNSWTPCDISKRASYEFMRGIAKTLAPFHIVLNGVVSYYRPLQTGKDLNKCITEMTTDDIYPYEIANIVSYLASDMADHMVGNMIICHK